MHRLFVALRPSPAVRQALEARMGGVAGARWQGDALLHLTLRFIGEVDGRRAEDVAAALTTLRHAPITVTLAGIGRFERRGRIESLWIGASPRDTLAGLHRKVDQALVRTGLAPEARAYLPHVTLARFGRDAGAIDAFVTGAGAVICSWQATDFRLYESHLGAEGPSYEAVARYPLG